VDGLAARKPNLLFYGARICSNLQRLGTPLCSGEKKGPRATRFSTSSFFAEEKKFPSADGNFSQRNDLLYSNKLVH